MVPPPSPLPPTHSSNVTDNELQTLIRNSLLILNETNGKIYFTWATVQVLFTLYIITLIFCTAISYKLGSNWSQDRQRRGRCQTGRCKLCDHSLLLSSDYDERTTVVSQNECCKGCVCHSSTATFTDVGTDVSDLQRSDHRQTKSIVGGEPSRTRPPTRQMKSNPSSGRPTVQQRMKSNRKAIAEWFRKNRTSFFRAHKNEDSDVSSSVQQPPSPSSQPLHQQQRSFGYPGQCMSQALKDDGPETDEEERRGELLDDERKDRVWSPGKQRWRRATTKVIDDKKKQKDKKHRWFDYNRSSMNETKQLIPSPPEQSESSKSRPTGDEPIYGTSRQPPRTSFAQSSTPEKAAATRSEQKKFISTVRTSENGTRPEMQDAEQTREFDLAPNVIELIPESKKSKASSKTGVTIKFDDSESQRDYVFTDFDPLKNETSCQQSQLIREQQELLQQNKNYKMNLIERQFSEMTAMLGEGKSIEPGGQKRIDSSQTAKDRSDHLSGDPKSSIVFIEEEPEEASVKEDLIDTKRKLTDYGELKMDRSENVSTMAQQHQQPPQPHHQHQQQSESMTTDNMDSESVHFSSENRDHQGRKVKVNLLSRHPPSVRLDPLWPKAWKDRCVELDCSTVDVCPEPTGVVAGCGVGGGGGGSALVGQPKRKTKASDSLMVDGINFGWNQVDKNHPEHAQTITRTSTIESRFKKVPKVDTLHLSNRSREESMTFNEQADKHWTRQNCSWLGCKFCT